MKAILVIDDMPTMCISCPCFMYEMDDTGICCANVNDEKAYGLDIKSKPNWCPLKPMPKRKLALFDPNHCDMEKEIRIIDEINGYNRCIDEILGGKE